MIKLAFFILSTYLLIFGKFTYLNLLTYSFWKFLITEISKINFLNFIHLLTYFFESVPKIIAYIGDS